MKKRVGFVVVAIAAVIVALWWRGCGRSSDGGGAAAAGGKASAASQAARPARVLAHPARVDGTVRDEQGAPIADAVVLAAGPDRDPVAVPTRADGGFTFEQLAPGDYRLLASAPGFVPARHELALHADERATAALTLARGGIALTGTVADTAGGPIEGALLIAIRHNRDHDARGAAAAFSAADGRYAFSLAPGDYLIQVRHPEYVDASASVALAKVPAVVDFTLLPGATIDGIVKDLATGAPIADAVIDVEIPDSTWRSAGDALATSGADGVFHLRGLAPGALTLMARLDRASLVPVNPAQLRLGLGEQLAGVELWVKAAPYVEGTVVGADRQPVAQAAVYADCGLSADVSVATDDDGGFRFIDLPRRPCRLTASSAHHRAAEPVPVTLADAPITGVVVSVVDVTGVSGRVDPPGPATITVEHSADPDRGDRGWKFPPAREATAGADGHFELSPLDPGEHRLVARTDDGRRGVVTVTVPATGTAEAVIALTPGGRISGRVRDDRGAPVVGATVLVKAPIADEPLAEPDAIRTDADGGFEATGLAAGTYRLAVADERGGPMRWAGAADAAAGRAPRKVELAAGETRTGVELVVVRDDGVINGIVRNPDGTPCPDAWVSGSLRWIELLQSSDPDDPMTTRRAAITTTQGGMAEGQVPPVLSGPDGSFTLRGLRVGRYDLTADADQGGLHGTADKVQTGADVTITLAGRYAIDGTVTRDGAPVTDFRVGVGGFGSFHGRELDIHDAGGRFHVGDLAPDSYQVRVTSERGTAITKVNLKRGNATVTLPLYDLGRVIGRIADERGRPFDTLMVYTGPAEGDPPRPDGFTGGTQMTWTDGRFELELLPGRYELMLSGPPGPSATGIMIDVVGSRTVDLGTVTRPSKPPPGTPP